MTDNLTSLAKLIRQRMDDLGIATQADLARRANLSPQDVNRLFGGGTKLPGPAKRRALADALGVSHLDLLVAAGEITREEIEPLKVRGTVSPNLDRDRMVEKLRSVDLSSREEQIFEAMLDQVLRANRKVAESRGVREHATHEG